jgi:RNA polymerase sigma-70 factor (ECF subfamily)
VQPNPSDHTAADLHARVGRYVRNSVSHPADAEDVLQDIFVKLLGSDGPNEATKLLPWVFTVARNRIIDFYRERARLRVVSDGLVEAGGAGADETAVDLSGALEVLMARLSEQDREALRAVDLEGLSQKEYADSLGLHYVTAKSRVQRARKRLRREFERCCTVVLDRRGAPLECTPRHQSVCGEAC